MTDTCDCLIGRTLTIEGDVFFTGNLEVDGQIRGNVLAKPGDVAHIHVTGQGAVWGEIRASQAVIDGVVHGSIQVADHVELRPGARVIGDIRYGTIEIHLGASIEGQLLQNELEVPGKVVSLKSFVPIGDGI